MIRVRLYELLSSLIQIDQEDICIAILDSNILKIMIADYKRFDTNTNVLILLNGTVKSILTS